MENRFGFIHEKVDIKILMLFILRRLSEPVSFDDLCELTLCDDGISYFDFSECVPELVDSEHILLEAGKFSILEKGERNGIITESNIPYTVRKKAEKSTAEWCARQSRNAMIKTKRTLRRKGGYGVSLSMSDGDADLISLELFAVSEEQAISLEKGFRSGAERIYNDLVKSILE